MTGGILLMDVFKAFDCIPYDMIAKLQADGMEQNILTLTSN